MSSFNLPEKLPLGGITPPKIQETPEKAKSSSIEKEEKVTEATKRLSDKSDSLPPPSLNRKKTISLSRSTDGTGDMEGPAKKVIKRADQRFSSSSSVKKSASAPIPSSSEAKAKKNEAKKRYDEIVKQAQPWMSMFPIKKAQIEEQPEMQSSYEEEQQLYFSSEEEFIPQPSNHPNKEYMPQPSNLTEQDRSQQYTPPPSNFPNSQPQDTRSRPSAFKPYVPPSTTNKMDVSPSIDP